MPVRMISPRLTMGSENPEEVLAWWGSQCHGAGGSLVSLPRSAPNTRPEGTVKGRKRFFYDPWARVWSCGDFRRFRALREVDAFYGGAAANPARAGASL